MSTQPSTTVYWLPSQGSTSTSVEIAFEVHPRKAVSRASNAQIVELLVAARELLVREGWTVGAYRALQGRCLVGALLDAAKSVGGADVLRDAVAKLLVMTGTSMPALVPNCWCASCCAPMRRSLEAWNDSQAGVEPIYGLINNTIEALENTTDQPPIAPPIAPPNETPTETPTDETVNAELSKMLRMLSHSGPWSYGVAYALVSAS